MPIPQVPGTELVQTPTAGVKRDFAALNAPNRARMQLADTVGDVAEQVGQFAMKLQAAKNFGIAADADREMRQASADFRESRRGRTDEENWGTEWNEVAQATRDKIYDTHQVGPDLKRQLENNFKEWDQSNAIEVRTLANKQAVNRAQERITNAANDAAKDGDEATINHLFSGAETHGIYFPEEAEAMKKGYLNKIDEFAAMNYIDANPAGAVDYLENKDNLSRLDPHQRKQMLTQARQRRASYQTDNANNNRAAADMNAPPDDAELERQVKAKEITARAAEQLKAYVAGTQVKQSHEDFTLLQGEVLTADTTTMKNPEEWAKQVLDDGLALAPIHRNMLVRQVQAKLAASKKQGAHEEKPVEKEIYAQMAKDFSEGFDLPFDLPGKPTETTERSGLFWMNKTTTKLPTDFATKEERHNWEANAPENVRKVASLRYAQQLDKMRTFFQQHPKATQPEAEEFRQQLVQPFLMDQVKQSLSPTPATPSRPPNAAFFSKSTGKWYDKDKNVIE